jgi:hypothetical protein
LTESPVSDGLLQTTPPVRIGRIRQVLLSGAIDAAMDLSGVTVVGDYLVLGADEGHRLQVLVRTPDGEHWILEQTLALAKKDQEVDIEAITFGQGYLYVAGSHSLRRRRLKPELSVRKNRERLLDVGQQSARNRLYRLSFDPASGVLGKTEYIDLSKRLRKDPLLGPFTKLPSKENGVEIEGIALRDGRLYLGFRGPVLRDNYVPVMTLAFDRPKDYALSFVRLDGQGIRDFVALDDGFLILSGPVNDAPGPFCLWWWDGADQIPGKDRTVHATRWLGEVSTSGGASAEGLALLSEENGHAEVVLVYDTDNAAQAVRMQVDLRP